MSEALLELAADILGPVVDDVVFVGGATVHLWLTEAAAPPVRATDDVDVICDVTSYVQYQALAERLRERGLEEAMDEPVICRWRHRESGLTIAVMPTSEEVLGFSNPWYDVGIATAIELELPSGKRIRAVAPPVVVATKLAAWLGRGGGDVLKSLDVHDIIVLVDGRAELIDELAVQPEELRDYVANELTSVREVDYFENVVQETVAAYADVANERAAIAAGRLDAIIARLRAA